MRRTMLFIPGNSPGMLFNADVFGADSIILDLEDAVAPSEKDAARILVRNALQTLRYECREIIVRINSLDTPYWEDDLAAVIPLKPALIMPTKVTDAAYMQRLSARIGALEDQSGIARGSVKLMPLLETALGIENAFSIATADKRLTALYLGAEDLTADFRCKRTAAGDEIFYSRSRLVLAARAAGIDAYDTPFTHVDDLEGLRADALLARGLGFTGKAVINPRHVACVNEVFSPSQSEIAYARDVLEAIRIGQEQGKGAVSLRGKMIDAPIVMRAKRVIEAAEAIYGEVPA